MSRILARTETPVATIVRVLGSPAVALALLLGVAFLTRPAAAQESPCRPRDEVVELLDRSFAENPVATGLTSGGLLLEVFTNETGSSWTVLVTSPRGISCPVAIGEGWQPRQPEPTGPAA